MTHRLGREIMGFGLFAKECLCVQGCGFGIDGKFAGLGVRNLFRKDHVRFNFQDFAGCNLKHAVESGTCHVAGNSLGLGRSISPREFNDAYRFGSELITEQLKIRMKQCIYDQCTLM